MDVKTIAYAEAPVPRYTSYPTAAQFHDGIDADVYRDWLRLVGPDDVLSVYVHVPFCHQLCWYCGCHTSVPNGYRRAARYLDHILEEIALVADGLGGRRRVAHVHFGGGTPTFLEPGDFTRLMAALGDRFRIEGTAEIAVETDPRSLTPEMTAALVANGVNRASLGVQDLDPEVQRLINRVQPFSQVARAARWLRQAGIERLNFDLMFGLPGQTVAHIADSVARCATLAPDRVSVFGYAHVPWFKKHQNAIPEDRLPDTAERLRQAEAARDALSAAGYHAVGFDHFARADDPLVIARNAGELKRNFQGYTTDGADALIAFGASAISRLPKGFVQNSPSTRAYGEAVGAKRLPVARGVAMTSDDALRAKIIEALLCVFAVDLGEFGPRGAALFQEAAPALRGLERDGIVAVSDLRVQVTAEGRRFARHAAACFDAYLGDGKGRHSVAI